MDYGTIVKDHLIASGHGKVSLAIYEEGALVQAPEKGNQLKYADFKEVRHSDDCNDYFVCIEPYDANSSDSSCFGDSGGPLTVYPNKSTGSDLVGVR